MDTLTHALSGALLARATAPALQPGAGVGLRNRMGAGFLAAAFPDADIVLSPLSPLAYLWQHRGVTHSFLLLPLWAVLLALIFAWMSRARVGWTAYFGVCALGIAAHILGDLITAYGTMIFAPLSNLRVAWATTFIIDLYFTGIIVIGLVASALWRTTRAPAVAGLAVLVAYVGFQALLQQQAIGIGEDRAQATGQSGTRVSAQARPVSPFNWMIVLEHEEAYDYALVNLLRREPVPVPTAESSWITRLDAAYQPVAHANWATVTRFGTASADVALAKAAWRQPSFEFFRWFSRFPMLYRLDRTDAAVCVWFRDLRFFTPGRPRWPFTYGECQSPGGEWSAYELVDGDVRRPVH
jgi:inner membrane protein